MRKRSRRSSSRMSVNTDSRTLLSFKAKCNRLLKPSRRGIRRRNERRSKKELKHNKEPWIYL